ncbi:hypothetical protein LCGC14_2109110 [marine sediment metagenome]|uniref:Uncharacterized protein n=1 Tax=marine sediment metagenome TaxID=412755 RepID=A0A0F9E7P8_9ZZZZ
MNEQPQVQPAEGFKPLAEWGEIEALSSEEIEAWKRSPVTRLESRVIATVARLQEQVKEADEVMGLAIAALNERVQEVDLLKRERDDYKAQSEQRREALEECQRLAIERIETADAAVKKDLYAADALMGIAKTARAAIEEEEK